MYNVLYSSAFSEVTGGGQKSLLLLLKGLDRSKFKPYLLCYKEGKLAEQARKLEVEIFIFPLGSLKSLNIFKIFLNIKELKKWLVENNISLIHSDSPKATFYLSLAARIIKTPLVYHARVSNKEPYLYEKLLYCLAAKIIVVSKGVEQRFVSFSGYKDKVALIYNAVNIKEFNSANDKLKFRQEYEYSDEIIIGIIGQLAPIKGQEYFLKAAAKVVQKNRNVKFIMIGDNYQNYQNYLESLIQELAIAEYVKIIPFREDIAQIMASLDVVVNASKLEGLSRVILEAMACAKAVVATDVGGNPEAVKDGESGLLVPFKNPDKLAEAILELINNDVKRIEMGKAGRKRVEALFSIEENVAKIEKVYAAILNSKGK